mmetsp:Transcript_986/g.1468  ORF Transcript_986/g.1468 Transcript_986/m.1468 type:complete len:212 (+) Transcript_986:358-993(+)
MARATEHEEDSDGNQRKEQDKLGIRSDPEDSTPADQKSLSIPNSDAAAEAKADRAASILDAVTAWEFVCMIMISVSCGLFMSKTEEWDELRAFPLPDSTFVALSFDISLSYLICTLFTFKCFQCSSYIVLLVFSLYLVLGVIASFAGFDALSKMNSFTEPGHLEYRELYGNIIITLILGGLGLTLGAIYGLIIGAIMVCTRRAAPTNTVEL